VIFLFVLCSSHDTLLLLNDIYINFLVCISAILLVMARKLKIMALPPPQVVQYTYQISRKSFTLGSKFERDTFTLRQHGDQMKLLYFVNKINHVNECTWLLKDGTPISFFRLSYLSHSELLFLCSGCLVCPNQSFYIFVQAAVCIPFRPSTSLFRLFWSVPGRTLLSLFRLS
jgi:hypothetical protein